MAGFVFLTSLVESVCGVFEKCAQAKMSKEETKRAVELAMRESVNEAMEAQRDIILAEASGSWLQRSWRPLVMLAFAGVVLVGLVVDIPMLENESPFWDVLEMGLGGYVIGRSAEKIAGSVSGKLRRK